MVVLLIPATVWAAEGLLYLDCYSKTNCGFCDAVKLVTKIASMAMTLAGSAALLVVVLAGLKMVLSRGISAEVAQAKKMLVGAITGILIVYGAWIFVNFVLYSFLSGGKVGVPQILTNTPWNQIKCIHEPDQETISFTERYNTVVGSQTDELTITDDGGCKSSWEKVGKGGSCGGNCADFQVNRINPNQCFDASPDLKDFLGCLKNKLLDPNTSYDFQTTDIKINSVSDDAGLLRCRGNNWTDPSCDHSQNSCHYGRGKIDGSYAIDLSIQPNRIQEALRGDQTDKKVDNDFYRLIKSCDGVWLYETNPIHIHVSSSECNGA
jgi:hypothetical protein